MEEAATTEEYPVVQQEGGRQLFRDSEPVINDVGLAVLALLVAESDPKDKEIVIRLVMKMLVGEGM